MDSSLTHNASVAKLGLTAKTLADLSTADKRRMFRLDIDPASLTWQQVMAINDRLLRRIQIGFGDDEKGNERIAGYDITVASGIMAILALTTGLRGYARTIGADGVRH